MLAPTGISEMRIRSPVPSLLDPKGLFPPKWTGHPHVTLLAAANWARFLPMWLCPAIYPGSQLEFKGPVRSSFSPKLGLTETETGPRLTPNLSNLDWTQEDQFIPVQLLS